MAPAADANDAQMTPAPSAVPTVLPDLPSQLKWYYSRLFPAALFGRWLGYGSDEYLSRREISFTLPGDIYLRWRSYGTLDALLSALKSQTPIKMDIGAVYNFPPKDRTMVTAALTPQAKELVFDIDLTDYDEVIHDADTTEPVARCDKHWAFMATAVKVLDAALREDFGFSRILWVYSGRRGIHGWVCDARARALGNAQRAAVADFLQLRFAGRGAARALSVPLHPSLARARAICDPAFEHHVLGAMDALGPGRAQALLADIAGEGVVRGSWVDKANDARKTAVERWRNIEKEVVKAGKTDFALRAACDYAVFKHTYPRLDVNVSKEINHLLKAPFCVHPKTGRVCVPFRAEEVDDFNPGLHAPVAAKLVAEIGKEGEETEKMREAVRIFEEFVIKVEEESRAANREEQLTRMDERNARELLAV